MHEGVGLIIGNEEKSMFFLQKKDKTYPITKWVDGFSFWGGAIEENDKSPYEALIREIQEELTVELDDEQIKYVGEFLVNSDEKYKFHLFELIVSDATLEMMKGQKVNEGLACLAKTETVLNEKWIWGLEQVIVQYLGLK